MPFIIGWIRDEIYPRGFMEDYRKMANTLAGLLAKEQLEQQEAQDAQNRVAKLLTLSQEQAVTITQLKSQIVAFGQDPTLIDQIAAIQAQTEQTLLGIDPDTATGTTDQTGTTTGDGSTTPGTPPVSP